jgi:hypothetical protein
MPTEKSGSGACVSAGKDGGPGTDRTGDQRGGVGAVARHGQAAVSGVRLPVRGSGKAACGEMPALLAMIGGKAGPLSRTAKLSLLCMLPPSDLAGRSQHCATRRSLP